MAQRISYLLLAGLLAAAHPALAQNLMAKAESHMPAPHVVSPDVQSLTVTQVLVRKSERRLYLLDHDEVVRQYPISLGDNPKGHKLYEGDERTPEGDYVLDWRNPGSDFHRSIHISYPNARDKELANAWGLDPGGSIMIHGLPNNAGDMAFAFAGLDWTDGCIAVNNKAIDEIWQLVPDGTPIRIVP